MGNEFHACVCLQQQVSQVRSLKVGLKLHLVFLFVGSDNNYYKFKYIHDQIHPFLLNINVSATPTKHLIIRIIIVMGCGSSTPVQTSSLSTPGPGHGVPAASVSPRNEATTSITASSEDSSDQAGNPTSRVFTVDPEPHKEFLPCHSPSAVELACQSTIEKLVPRKSEESLRKEVQEVFQRWKEGGQLADIESYSLSIPPSFTRSVVDLSRFLTKSTAYNIREIEDSELHTQMAKAYCIYCWVSNNITWDRELWQVYQSGDNNLSLDDSLTERVLERRRAVSSGYANLFKSLVDECGMIAEVVHGNIKVWKSQSLESSENDFEASRKNMHTWNFVSASVNSETW